MSCGGSLSGVRIGGGDFKVGSCRAVLVVVVVDSVDSVSMMYGRLIDATGFSTELLQV